MTNLEIIQKLQQIVKEKPYEYQAVEDLFEMLRIYEQENHKQAHLWNKDVRRISSQQVIQAKSDSLAEKFYYLNKRSLLLLEGSNNNIAMIREHDSFHFPLFIIKRPPFQT